ncbi:MAG: S41 family peptidase [bacterium]
MFVKRIFKNYLLFIFYFFVFFFGFFSFFYSCSFANNYLNSYINNYFYAIQRIYKEDIFVKENLYDIFKKNIENIISKKNFDIKKDIQKIDQIFMNTLYFYSNDRYLKIYKSDIFKEEYMNQNKLENLEKEKNLDYILKDLNDKINISLFFKDNFLIYYIKIYYFPVGYYKYFRDYLFSFYKDSYKNLKKIVIIDLLDNTGGSLYTASFFINLFYPSNSYLFTIHYKHKSINYYSGSDYKDYFKDSIVFVVQNDLTASAAEVVSGTLKRKGIILGDFSYGKPFIQVNLEVNDLTILYTNSFLNFNYNLEPHDKVKPDIFLNQRELNKEFILNFVYTICYYLFYPLDLEEF